MKPETVTIEAGQTSQLTSSVSPVDADDLTVSYSSSDATITTVDEKGLITGVKVGKADVTVTTTDGDFTAKTATVVTVPEKKVTGITLNQKTATAKVGDKKTLSATVVPEDADNQNVTWKSSDEKTATVDDKGNVTAVAEGTATVTVTTEDGSFTSECVFTIAAAA